MREGALLNRTVGGYRLMDPLGAGGMGEVYRAVHLRLGRVAAVKVLSGVKPGGTLLSRFHNEARIHAGLSHPNIVTLYDFLEVDGWPVIVMEYVDGETLDARIRRSGGIPVPDALRLFERVVDAVGYLHARGVLHRDLKPNNIKLTSGGDVKLLDFGIA